MWGVLRRDFSANLYCGEATEVFYSFRYSKSM